MFANKNIHDMCFRNLLVVLCYLLNYNFVNCASYFHNSNSHLGWTVPSNQNSETSSDLFNRKRQIGWTVPSPQNNQPNANTRTVSQPYKNNLGWTIPGNNNNNNVQGNQGTNNYGGWSSNGLNTRPNGSPTQNNYAGWIVPTDKSSTGGRVRKRRNRRQSPLLNPALKVKSLENFEEKNEAQTYDELNIGELTSIDTYREWSNPSKTYYKNKYHVNIEYNVTYPDDPKPYRIIFRPTRQSEEGNKNSVEVQGYMEVVHKNRYEMEDLDVEHVKLEVLGKGKGSYEVINYVPTGKVGLYGGYYSAHPMNASDYQITPVYVHGRHQILTHNYYDNDNYVYKGSDESALGYYVDYALRNVRTRYYHEDQPQQTFTVHHYYHQAISSKPLGRPSNKEHVSIKSTRECNIKTTWVCPMNTEPLCLLNGTIYCISELNFTRSCKQSETQNTLMSCVDTFLPCKKTNDVKLSCFNGQLVTLPCLTTIIIDEETIKHGAESKVLMGIAGNFILVPPDSEDTRSYCVSIIIQPTPPSEHLY